MIEQQGIRNLVAVSSLDISPIKYHHLCSSNHTLFCFFDETYLCVCDENHKRADCFGYDQNLDRCSRCLAGGRCLKGNPARADDFICLCRQCHYGRLCQFNTEQLSFTVDSLIVHDPFGIQLLYLIVAAVMVVMGGMTNYASFVTFKRPYPRKVGVGNYLLLFAIFSQCSLVMLLLKIVHIVLGASIGEIPCKLISYLLSGVTRFTYWLASWITIERVCFVLVPFGKFLKKPRLALLISLVTLLVIAIMHVHELLFYIALKDPNGQTLCVIETTPIIAEYSRITVLMHYIVPFCIQIVSTTLLIVRAAQSRAAVTIKRHSFTEQLKRQFHYQRELYLAPIIIIVSSLPHIILSFSLACISLSDWQRHAILVAYFLSYAPQILGFVLFVLPSSSYLNEFRQTPLARRTLSRWLSSK